MSGLKSTPTNDVYIRYKREIVTGRYPFRVTGGTPPTEGIFCVFRNFVIYYDIFVIYTGTYKIIESFTNIKNLCHILQNGGEVIEGFCECGIGLDKAFLVFKCDFELVVAILLACLGLF